MSKPIELNFRCSLDIVKTDLLTSKIDKVEFIKHFRRSKRQKITVFCQDKVHISNPAKIRQLSVSLIWRHNKLDVVLLKLYNEVVGHIGTDINRLSHLFVSLLVTSVKQLLCFHVAFLTTSTIESKLLSSGFFFFFLAGQWSSIENENGLNPATPKLVNSFENVSHKFELILPSFDEGQPAGSFDDFVEPELIHNYQA